MIDILLSKGNFISRSAPPTDGYRNTQSGVYAAFGLAGVGRWLRHGCLFGLSYLACSFHQLGLLSLFSPATHTRFMVMLMPSVPNAGGRNPFAVWRKGLSRARRIRIRIRIRLVWSGLGEALDVCVRVLYCWGAQHDRPTFFAFDLCGLFEAPDHHHTGHHHPKHTRTHTHRLTYTQRHSRSSRRSI